jgi:hypothetical protein
MNFCPKCGRQRSGDARFCGGCGHDYSDAATDGASAFTAEPVAEVAQERDVERAAHPGPWDVPADAPWDRPADATRIDLAPEPTRLDLQGPPLAAPEPPTRQPSTQQPRPGASPDPFASWFVQGKPTEQPTETVLAYGSNSGTGSAPPTHPVPPMMPPPQPPYSPGPDRRSAGGRRVLWTVVVLIVALAAGGGAYALVKGLGKHPSAQSTTPPTRQASTGAGSTPPASPTAKATASASGAASTSVTATPTPSPSLVTIAPGVGENTAVPPVETLLSHYFDGINTHNYTEYSSTLTPQNQANQPQSNFESGYSTTTDSGMTLTSLTATGGGDLTATVTFTSHQAAADSVDNSTCNNWTLNYYLVPNGTGYLISPAPSGYQPTYSDC